MARSGIAILAVMVVVGWPSASTPFRGDQALYTLMAQQLHRGEVLYRDVWDATNPGVIWFYQAAGTLFGFHEEGIHLAEWLWWLAFVLFLSGIARTAHSLETLPLAPALLVGACYFAVATADSNHLTRAEGLACFPLTVAVWAALRAVEKSCWRWWLLAGMAGGIVLTFKLIFGLMLAAGWLIPLFRARHSLLKSLGGLVLGVVLVILAAVAWILIHGGVAETIETLFVIPRQIMAAADLADMHRLTLSVRRFLETQSPILAAGTAVVLLHARRDPFVASMSLTALAAPVVILAQRWSWWDYHFQLLGIPMAILAGYGWPGIWKWCRELLRRPLDRRERWVLGCSLACLFLPTIGFGLSSYARLVRHRFGLTAADRETIRRTTGHAYEIAEAETRWLAEPSAGAGAIFVAGDPCFHWLSSRPMATRYNGWSLELFTPELWHHLERELQDEPPFAIFVGHTAEIPYDRILRDRSPQLMAWLQSAYRVERTSIHGTWYRRVP